MKRYIILPILGLAAMPMMAQNMTDAVRISSKDIAGSARYRSMGGAFGALGGDISAMGDNPAGMGVFRGTTQLTLTPNLSFNMTSTDGSSKEKETNVDGSFSNLGFLMSFKTPNANSLVNVNFGMNIRHSEGINRKYTTRLNKADYSFAEYLANSANNALLVDGRFTDPGYLYPDDNYQTAWDDVLYPISSLLGYEMGAIGNCENNGQLEGTSTCYYDGNGRILIGDQRLYVKEKVRMDEYDINLSANWSDFFYGGITVSIADYSSVVNSDYDENFGYNKMYLNYCNYLETKGSGASVKAGFIVRPTDQFRLGFALHTPTWMKMEDSYGASMETDYYTFKGRYDNGWDYRFFTPWEYQFSAAYIFGRKGLLSVEADMADYSTAKFKTDRDYYRASTDEIYGDLNDAMKKDFGALQTTVKVGGEYRVTDICSLRAGYVFKTSPYTSGTSDNRSRSWDNGNFGDDNTLLFDSSTKPNFSILGTQQIFSCGVGWRWSDWFIDLSVQDRLVKETVASFPTTDAIHYADYDAGTVEFCDTRCGNNHGAVKANYTDMLYQKLSFDMTIGLSF